MKQYFRRVSLEYEELEYILQLFPQLGKYIQPTTDVNFRINTDLFSCFVHTIIAQQISNAALDSIWHRLVMTVKEITPKNIDKTQFSVLCDIGISSNKANTIKKLAVDFLNKKINVKKIKKMPDQEIYDFFSQYKGIGYWTIQNVLIFCLYRNNIFPINDVGINKGLRLVLGHMPKESEIKKICCQCDKHLTTLSICLWYIANTN